MTHQFKARNFYALYALALSGIAIGTSFFFNLHPQDWDTRWRGGVYILIAIVGLIVIRWCQTYGESISIDSSGIKLDFFLLRRTIPLSELEAIFHSTKVKQRFIIKTTSGEKILIPLRNGLNEFIFDAQRQYNFRLVQFEVGNLDNV